MTGKTHLAAGALSSLFVLVLGSEYNFIFLFVGILGGLFPDLDASEAKIHHIGISITRKIKIKPFLIPAKIISTVFKHRGWLHSFLGLFFFSSVLASMLYYFEVKNFFKIIFVFSVAYFSHLLTDSATKSGVPLFYPITKKHFYFLPKQFRLKTGSIFESFIEILFLILSVAVFFLLIISGYIKFDLMT